MGYQTVAGKFSGKGWKLGTVKSICKRVDDCVSATVRMSGLPKMAQTEENVNHVAELICSQDDQPGTSKSTRQIAKDLTVSQTSLRRIAIKDLNLSAFRRVPAQVLTDATKTNRLEQCNQLLRRLTVRATKQFFSDRRKSILRQPTHKQPEQSSVVEREEIASYKQSFAGQMSKVCSTCHCFGWSVFRGKGACQNHLTLQQTFTILAAPQSSF